MKMTVAQALVAFLAAQHVERDGAEQQFFAGILGIFGHGNVAGIGQALMQDRRLPYVPARNEQAMVHLAAAYARQSNRLRTWACTTSIGPGATNLVTGAATATINRIPVLLLPGDTFATRRVDPALQQLELPGSIETTVNDSLRAVSRYWDRIHRPEQLASALLAAMRVLTDPAETGAVTLCLPQDVQAELVDVPGELLERRVWHVARPVPDTASVERAVAAIRAAKRPLIVTGGGTIYAAAEVALEQLVDATGVPVCETQAGKGALAARHELQLGGVGSTGTFAANRLAREADVVIGVGTRWSDFTTASRTAFQDPDVTFVNLNVASVDAHKLRSVPVVGDARASLELLQEALAGWQAPDAWTQRARSEHAAWDAEVERIYASSSEHALTQGQLIGAVEQHVGADGVVVCAAGSMPGDLHKLWRAAGPHSYHVEYGFSCMGYEVAGGIGVALAEPDSEVVVLVGDGSWLMLSSEVVTAVQEGVALTIVLVDNHGYGSIGALSTSLGTAGWGTQLRRRHPDGSYDEEPIELDLVANAASLGCHAMGVTTLAELQSALAARKPADRPTVIVASCPAEPRVGGYESWWEVPVAELAEQVEVVEARAAAEPNRTLQRPLV